MWGKWQIASLQGGDGEREACVRETVGKPLGNMVGKMVGNNANVNVVFLTKVSL